MTLRSRTLACAVAGAALVAGCGGDEPAGPAPSPSGGGGGGSSAATSCDRQQVPGHEGVDVQITGGSCEQAREVIRAAVGKGRQAYEAAGFSCEPSDASGGDTNYTCTGDGAELTFRYGAA